MQARDPRPDSTTPKPLQPGSAIFVPTAFIAKSGVIDFAHKNHRPVHGGILYAGADNSARAMRRRAQREARRVARKEGRR